MFASQHGLNETVLMKVDLEGFSFSQNFHCFWLSTINVGLHVYTHSRLHKHDEVAELTHTLQTTCCGLIGCIRESVDSLCRDGSDMPIVCVH